MKREELVALQQVEEEHWFYKGKRELVFHWLEKLGYKKGAHVRILDAGAGTGILVRDLRKAYGKLSVEGVEYSADARALANEMYQIDLREGSILELPLETAAFEVAIALDVLEHVERDDTALSELLRVTKKGGGLILNVPAMPSLWSDWDVALGHYRRYTMSTWMKLLQQPLANEQITIEYVGYINAAAFPLIFAYRAFRKLVPSKERAEDKVPGAFLNGVLKSSFVAPAKWTWFKPPFGVSILCVVRKLKD